MPDDLDFRLLRYFVAVAEELHFSRAAQRLLVAQQALSRDIRQLESRVGTRLFDRTTRRVDLTPAGATLLVRARELLALHDATMLELRGERRELTVDVVGSGLTPALVLAEARRIAPDVEFFARYVTGPESAIPLLHTERIDVTFGRYPGNEPGLRRQAIRDEPLAVLVPEQHPLAELAEIPLAALPAARVCSRAGNHATPGWEHAMVQLLEPLGLDFADAHPHVQGGDELAQHLHERGAPILTVSTQPAVPGAVLRPLAQPTAVFPWSMIWRSGREHPGLAALQQAARTLALADGWNARGSDVWLPEPEASSLAPRGGPVGKD